MNREKSSTALACLSRREALLRADVTLVADGSRRELTLGLEKVSSLVPEGSVYEYYRVDGIPVVSLGDPRLIHQLWRSLLQMPRRSDREEAVIIDLRELGRRRSTDGKVAGRLHRWCHACIPRLQAHSCPQRLCGS